VTEAHYALDADPADNPRQPDVVFQGLHKVGAKMHAVRTQAARPALLAAQASLGDVYLDYSGARPSNASLLSVPKLAGVCRYLSPLNADGSYYGPTASKMITVAELNNLVNVLHLDVRHNYEWYEGRMAEGAPAGRQDGNWSGLLAYRVDTAVGRSTARDVIASDDTSGTPYESVVAYLLAFQTQLNGMPGEYLAGYYGPQAKIARLATDPRITWPIFLWQTCAWSGGVYGGTGHLYQAICAPVSPTLPGCDTNFRMKLDPGDDDMPTAEEIATAVWAKTITTNGTATQHLVRASDNAVSAANYGKANQTALAGIKPVDQVALQRAVTAAIAAALADGLDPDVVKAGIEAGFAAADVNLKVELSGSATTPPAP
jgi:hypothetical protein